MEFPDFLAKKIHRLWMCFSVEVAQGHPSSSLLLEVCRRRHIRWWCHGVSQDFIWQKGAPQNPQILREISYLILFNITWGVANGLRTKWVNHLFVFMKRTCFYPSQHLLWTSVEAAPNFVSTWKESFKLFLSFKLLPVLRPSKLSLRWSYVSIGGNHDVFAKVVHQKAKAKRCGEDILGGGFKHFLFSPPIWGRFPIWLIFFKWVGSTTNQYKMAAQHG